MTEEDISMLDDILKDEFDERPAAEKQPEPEKTFKPIAPEPTEDEAISDLLYAGTGPAPPAPASPEAAGPLFEFHTVPAARDSREPSPKAPEPEEDLQPASTIPAPQAKQRTRYFVIKSYSAENVTISLRRGIWATQKQNEQVFNDAFLDTPRVILLFSINGSRHFQGYARMTSLIQPKQHNRNRDFGGDVAKWGNTFSVSWERVGSVPFAETDHLRNPLAENLPLTRARDGQEVTERIGEELCRLIDHHSVPISPDLDFPITEQERECLMNDPRSFGSRGSLGNKSRGNRGGFEPYPARGRNAPLGPGGREEGRDRVFRPRIDGPLRGRREVTRRDERDDRWDDPDRGTPLRLLPPPDDLSRMMARPVQDVMYHQQEPIYSQQMPSLVDVDLTQLTYEEYLALKQRQQQQFVEQRPVAAVQWSEPLMAPQFMQREVSPAMFGLGVNVGTLPPEGYARYGNFGAF